MARLLDQVLGHHNNIENFLRTFQSGKLASSFLFVGQPGIGKKTVALALAQVLTCEKSPAQAHSLSPSGCGACGSCLRISNPKNRQTESLLLIEPEKNLIKLEQAHSILEFLRLRSLGKRRVIIIDQAETMNPQAANSLLKVLEEPPAETYFFLIAKGSKHVLPTLRSRSQVMNFQPLTVSDLRKKSKAADWILKASQGSFENLEQLSSPAEAEIRRTAVAWLKDFMQTPQGYLKSQYRDEAKDRASALKLSQHLSWLLRDAVYMSQDRADHVMSTDQSALLGDLAKKFSGTQLIELCERALKVQEILSHNADSSLSFEKLWIEGVAV
jgi:DNA polymerase-3 subunit delta'